MTDTDPPPNGPEDVGWSNSDRGLAPLRYRIPEGSKRRSCVDCAAIVYFLFNGWGKRLAVDPDGLEHKCAAVRKRGAS